MVRFQLPDELEWKASPGFGDQVREAVIYTDPESGTYARLVDLAPGFSGSDFLSHSFDEITYVVQGELVNAHMGEVHRPGSFACIPSETAHGPFRTETGARLLEFRHPRRQGPLHGQVAIVTGAGRGIGAGVARRLGKDGAAVLVADLDGAAAARVAGELNAAGVCARPCQVDVTAPEQVEAMVQAAEELGPVTILVHAAGIIGREAPFRELTEAEWRRVLEIDLLGTVFCNRAVIDGMVSRGYGRIVNLASITAKEGLENVSHYSAAKASVVALTKALGKEVARTGVTVNCIAPAVIATDMAREQISEAQMARLLAKIPMGRMGTVEEVAGLVRYLVSREASFVTGQCYDISGGRATY